MVMWDGSGVKVTSRSPSELNPKPEKPAAIRSPAFVPITVKPSAASPRFTANSISGMFDSEVKPGPMNPSDISTVSFSTVPAVPLTVIRSVFVFVASPQAAGVSPNHSSPEAFTFRVASDPDVISAVIRFVPESYTHDSSAAPAEPAPTANAPRSAAPRTARRVFSTTAAFLSR